MFHPRQPYGGISRDGGCSTRVIKPTKLHFGQTIKTLTKYSALYPKGNFYFKEVMKNTYKL